MNKSVDMVLRRSIPIKNGYNWLFRQCSWAPMRDRSHKNVIKRLAWTKTATPISSISIINGRWAVNRLGYDSRLMRGKHLFQKIKLESLCYSTYDQIYFSRCLRSLFGVKSIKCLRISRDFCAVKRRTYFHGKMTITYYAFLSIISAQFASKLFLNNAK